MPEEDDFAAGFNSQPQESAAEKPEAEKPEADQPPATEPAAESKEAPPQGEDELSKLKAQMADALHRERSSANRISAFAKENEALKRRLDAIEREAAAAKAKPAAAAEDDADLDDVLKGAPDLKAAVEARVKRATEPLLRRLDEVAGRLKEVDERASQAAAEVQPLRERSEQAEAAQVAQQLQEQFPGWMDEVKGSKFQQWLGEQSPEIQGLYQNGTTVRQAGAVLKLYRADTGALVKPAEAQAPAPKATDAANARLRQASGIPSKPSKAKVDDMDDFSAGFRMATT